MSPGFVGDQRKKTIRVPIIIPGIILLSDGRKTEFPCRVENENRGFKMPDWSVFEQTLGARSEEVEPMVLNYPRNSLTDALVEIFLGRYIQILHTATMQTDKMIVFVYECIVASGCLAEIQFPDLPLMLQDT